jgi:hypothetical protein
MTQGVNRDAASPPERPAQVHTPVSQAGYQGFCRGDVLAIMLWTLMIAGWFWDVVSCRSALFYFDITEINLPYRKFVAEEYAAGRFSRWHPGLYCGFPLFSESQAGYLHPSKLLYLIPGLPAWAAFGFDSVGSIWLAGLAAYLWLRRHAGPVGAFGGAAVYALGGYTWAHFVHTSMLNAIVSVPLVLWGFEGALTQARGRFFGLWIAANALACQVFAGHLQDAVQTGLLLGLYALWLLAMRRSGAERLLIASWAGMILLLGIGLSAVQWIPSLELINRSVRARGLSFDEMTYGSWHPELIPAMVLPEAFGSRAFGTDWLDGAYPYHEMTTHLGAVALLLALVGLTRVKDRWISFWPVLAIVSLVLMLGRYTVVYDLIAEIPVLKSMRIPVRYSQWLQVAAAALVAMGLEQRGVRIQRQLCWVIAIWLAILIGVLAVGWHAYAPALAAPPRNPAWTVLINREMGPAIARTLLLSVAALGTLLILSQRSHRASRLSTVSRSALPLWLVLELGLPHAWDVPRVDPRYWIDPPAGPAKQDTLPGDDGGTIQPRRIFGYPDQTSAPRGYAVQHVDFSAIRQTLSWSLAPVWGLASGGGVSPLVTERMVAYTDAAMPGRGRFEIESVNTLLFRLAHPELDLLQGNGDWKRFLADDRKGPEIWIQRGYPRLRLLGQPRYAASPEDAANLLRRSTRALLDQIVVEDPARPLATDSQPQRGTARIVTEIPERIEIEAQLDQPGYLFLADSWDPGWSVTVNGRPRPVVPAYLAFRAVFLQAGRHTVVFTYEPAGFRAGAIVSVGSVLMGLAWSRFASRRFKLAPLPLDGPDPGAPRLAVIVVGAALVVILLSALVPIPGHGGAVSERWQGSWHQLR